MQQSTAGNNSPNTSHGTQANTSLFTLGHTPIKLPRLKHHLKNYKHKQFLLNGFQHGFQLQYMGPRRPRHANNLQSAKQHPTIINQKISKELSLQRIGGPFKQPPFPTLQISPIGLVPKKDGDYRLIHHLSYPDQDSINFYLDPIACSVHYSSIDDAAAMIASLGQNTLLAKSDIKSAFRLLPVAISDFDLLGFQFQGSFYFDKMLPFGASISCALWEKFATALHWLTQNTSRNPNILHYLDDFLFAGKANSHQCQNTLVIFQNICQDLGVPIAQDKTTNPATIITYLGIEFNTTVMSMKLPQDKLSLLLATIQTAIQHQKVTLKFLQSLIGLLNFACQVVAPGRAFCRRLIDATMGIKKQHHRIRVTAEMKHDLQVWQQFLANYNGITVISNNIWSSDTFLQLFTDSAGGENGSFGIFFSGSWAHAKWPEKWLQTDVIYDMTFLELFPVYVAILTWRNSLSNKRILFHIDNMAVVHVLNNSTSKSKRVMAIVRELVLVTLKCNITVRAQHIPSKQNSIADCISRSQWKKFQQLAPDADPKPTQLPSQIWNVWSPNRND